MDQTEQRLRARICSLLLIFVLILMLINAVILFNKILNDVTGFETVVDETEDEYRIYKLNGTPVSGLYYAGEGICLFADDGRQLYGFQEVNGSTYFFSYEDGHMLKCASVTVDEKEYTFDVFGKLVNP